MPCAKHISERSEYLTCPTLRVNPERSANQQQTEDPTHPQLTLLRHLELTGHLQTCGGRDADLRR